MPAFFAGVGAFFGNKLVQYGMLVAVIALMVMGAIHAAKGAYTDLKKNIRQDVVQEYTIRELNQQLEEAEKDRKFWQEQSEKNEMAVENLRADLQSMSARVGQSRTIIREQIASGELPDGQMSPVQSATIDQIENMEQERRQREAANVEN